MLDVTPDGTLDTRRAGPQQQTTAPTPLNLAGALDIRAVLQFFRRRWPIMAAAIVIGIAGAYYHLSTLTPMYTASAQLLIDKRSANIVNLGDVARGVAEDSNRLATELRLLRSREFVGRVVDQLDLVDDPEFNPALRPPERSILSQLAGTLFGADAQTGDGGDAAGDRGSVTATGDAAAMRDRVVSTVIGRLQAVPEGSGLTVIISFTSENRHRAAEVANTIADAFVVDQFEARYTTLKRANEWLTERLGALREEMQSAEEAVVRFRLENDMVGPRGRTITETELASLNSQLVQVRSERTRAELRLRRIRQASAAGSTPDELGDVMDISSVSALRQHERQLQRREEDLGRRYGDRHPTMIEIRNEREDVRRQLQGEFERVQRMMEEDLQASRARESALLASIQEAQGVLNEEDRTHVQLRELERQAESVRGLYETFLARFRQTGEQEHADQEQRAQVRILSPALAPGAPSSPNRDLYIGGGFLISAMIGFLIAVMLEMLDRGYRTARQIEDDLQLLHLTTVPFMRPGLGLGKSGNPADMVIDKPLSAFSESLRALRAAISLADVDRPPKVILVTSSLPGEGKTTIALSLARSAALSGIKVAVVDCDLRRPSLVVAERRSDRRGIAQYLAGEATLEDIVVRDEASGLYIYQGGRTVATAAEIVGSERMRQFVESLRAEFDLVVLDSPPVMPVVDSRILARLADKVIFVVKWQDTARDAVRNSVKDLAQFGAPLFGIVLNQLDVKRAAKYGYGNTSYYYSQYKRYYTS